MFAILWSFKFYNDFDSFFFSVITFITVLFWFRKNLIDGVNIFIKFIITDSESLKFKYSIFIQKPIV